MWGVVILFVVLVAVVSFIALCYHSRRASRLQRPMLSATPLPVAGAPAPGGLAPPGHRLGVVAADSPSGRHIIIVGVPPGGQLPDGAGPAAATLAARARQLLPNGKVPTPPGVIANLPTYEFAAPPAERSAKPATSAAAAGAGGGGGGGDADAAADGDGGSGQPVCVICCDEFSQGDVIKLLPCMHQYHAGCIDGWLARDVTCPICKESVIRAAGLSESQALDIAVASVLGAQLQQAQGAGAGQGQARRQRRAVEAAWPPPAGPPPGGVEGVAADAAAGGRRGAPDMELQAQQQRLWQLMSQQQHQQQYAGYYPGAGAGAGAPPRL